MSTTAVSPPQVGWTTVATVVFSDGGKGHDYFIPTNVNVERIKPGTRLVVDVDDTMKIVEIRSMRKATKVDHLKRALGVYPGHHALGEVALTMRPFARYCTGASTPAPTPTEQEPKLMGQIVIENKTLINGRDISQYTNSELYALIAKAEQEIEELKLITNKPKRLALEIEAKSEALLNLVALLDEQDDQPKKKQ